HLEMCPSSLLARSPLSGPNQESPGSDTRAVLRSSAQAAPPLRTTPVRLLSRLPVRLLSRLPVSRRGGLHQNFRVPGRYLARSAHGLYGSRTPTPRWSRAPLTKPWQAGPA